MARAVVAQDVNGDFLRVAGADSLQAPLAAAVEGLNSQRISRHMAFLADPRREGRGLGTRGLDATVQYLVNQLKAAGIPPMGGSYLQPVPMRQVIPEAGTISLHTWSGTLEFRVGRDAVLPTMEPGIYSGPLVFVGHGIQEPTLGHDDFRGLDVRGKVVVFLAGCPPGADWLKPEIIAKYASERLADRYDSRMAVLEKLGALAGIAIEEGLDHRIAKGKEPVFPYFLAASGVPVIGEPPLARVAMIPGLLTAISSGLPGTASLNPRGQVRPYRGFNVIGKVKGTNPALGDEAILMGAHMDHLGMPGGILHPGADDNASGVAALLEITRAIAGKSAHLQRTILIAFWTGEEEGKFGSGHYTRHPRWPLAATKAYLNLDMIAHPWTPAELRTLAVESGMKNPNGFLDGLDPNHFAEPGLSSGHRDLGPILIQAGRGTGMSLHLDWTDGRNGGSDYRDFARQDLPFVRFFGNYFPGYHKPGDTLDQLNPGQVRRMAQLVLATAWLLADR